MGNSILEANGRYASFYDWDLIGVVGAVLHVARGQSLPEGLLDSWRRVAGGMGPGCSDLYLETLDDDPESRRLLLGLLGEAYELFDSYGDSIPCGVLNGFDKPEGDIWLHPQDTARLKATVRRLKDLLRDREPGAGTRASTSI